MITKSDGLQPGLGRTASGGGRADSDLHSGKPASFTGEEWNDLTFNG